VEAEGVFFDTKDTKDTKITKGRRAPANRQAIGNYLARHARPLWPS